MDMMMRIVVLALITAIFAVLLRKNAPEFALLLIMAAGIWVILLVISHVAGILDTMDRLSALSQLDEAIIVPVMKTVALSILTRVTGEICRSAGEGAIATFVEIGGAVLSLSAALPLVEAVLDLVIDVLL